MYDVHVHVLLTSCFINHLQIEVKREKKRNAIHSLCCDMLGSTFNKFSLFLI